MILVGRLTLGELQARVRQQKDQCLRALIDELFYMAGSPTWAARVAPPLAVISSRQAEHSP